MPAKKYNFILSDLIVSDDIGLLPDQNTAAARTIYGITRKAGEAVVMQVPPAP